MVGEGYQFYWELGILCDDFSTLWVPWTLIFTHGLCADAGAS